MDIQELNSRTTRKRDIDAAMAASMANDVPRTTRKRDDEPTLPSISESPKPPPPPISRTYLQTLEQRLLLLEARNGQLQEALDIKNAYQPLALPLDAQTALRLVLNGVAVGVAIVLGSSFLTLLAVKIAGMAVG